jgi:hypothetical protein
MNSASLGTTAAGHNKCSIPDSRNVEDCPVGRDSVAAVQVPSESIAINIWIYRIYEDPRKQLSCVLHEPTRRV